MTAITNDCRLSHICLKWRTARVYFTAFHCAISMMPILFAKVLYYDSLLIFLRELPNFTVGILLLALSLSTALQTRAIGRTGRLKYLLRVNLQSHYLPSSCRVSPYEMLLSTYLPSPLPPLGSAAFTMRSIPNWSASQDHPKGLPHPSRQSGKRGSGGEDRILRKCRGMSEWVRDWERDRERQRVRVSLMPK